MFLATGLAGSHFHPRARGVRWALIVLIAMFVALLASGVRPATTGAAPRSHCRGHHRVKLTVKAATMRVNVAWTCRKVKVTGSLIDHRATPASAFVGSGKMLLADVSSVGGERTRIDTGWRRVKPVGKVKAITLNLVLDTQPPDTAGKVVRLP